MLSKFRPWILDASGEPKQVDLREWSIWYENADRKLARDQVGDFDVSTVFLGLDHAWDGGLPQLWETCVFDHGKPTRIDLGGVVHETCDSDVVMRYTTRSAALQGHQATMIAYEREMANRKAQRAARKAKK